MSENHLATLDKGAINRETLVYICPHCGQAFLSLQTYKQYCCETCPDDIGLLKDVVDWWPDRIKR